MARRGTYNRVINARGQRYTMTDTFLLPNVSSSTAPQIFRVDPPNFQRFANLAPMWQWYRIKSCKLTMTPLQNPAYWYNLSSASSSAVAISYIETDGLNVPASNASSALERPRSMRHKLTGAWARTFKPQCVQSVTLQATATTTAIVNRNINPWLPTTFLGTTVDRVGVGFHMPLIGNTNPTSATPSQLLWEPKLTCDFEFKATQRGS